MDLLELQTYLGHPIPECYSEYIRNNNKSDFDPKTICILNLELRENNSIDLIHDKFFLTGDGCGNYYFISTLMLNDTVKLLSHDPQGIEDTHMSFEIFMKTAYQENKIQPNNKFDFHISKTITIAESILDPIRLVEWTDIIEGIDHLTYKGYKEVTNPFTKEKSKIKWPGLAIYNDGEEVFYIELRFGRVFIGTITNTSKLVLNSIRQIITANKTN